MAITAYESHVVTKDVYFYDFSKRSSSLRSMLLACHDVLVEFVGEDCHCPLVAVEQDGHALLGQTTDGDHSGFGRFFPCNCRHPHAFQHEQFGVPCRANCKGRARHVLPLSFLFYPLQKSLTERLGKLNFGIIS